MLPDEVLLAIVDFSVCVGDEEGRWVTFIHVCRRWRYIVFTSPHRLDLRLFCTERTPVREMLHIWPALPIAVWIYDAPYEEIPDNIVAALEHNDRVCEIYARRISGDEFEQLATVPVMQGPFPALTHLHLDAYLESYTNEAETPIIPDSFLGGSAPLLQSLHVMDFVYPALPKLLLSATGLVSLSLHDRCYFSPQVMVDCLTSLTRLETLVIQFFRFPWPHEGYCQPSQYPTPLTQRTDLRPLPVLTTLVFQGATEYFDDIFTHIDAPRLDNIQIVFTTNPPTFDFSRIFLFTNFKETFEAPDHVHMGIESDRSVTVTLSSRRGTTSGEMLMRLAPRGNEESNWKFWDLRHDRRRRLASLLSPANLNFARHDSDIRKGTHTLRDVGNDQWLDLFRFFSAARNLYLSEGLAICVTPALRELVGEGVTEVLPALQNLFIINFESSGLIKEAIGEFVAARELSGHPVIVQSWTKEIGE